MKVRMILCGVFGAVLAACGIGFIEHPVKTLIMIVVFTASLETEKYYANKA